MDQPKIPTLKDAQKPQVKIKGMGAGVTLFDRLKQFKKKDLAFILAGLGTLFMAPLAEHFMMAPESGDAALQQGWGGGKGPGSNLFGSGSSPYENGNNNIAQGGAIGGAGDIITPLNVRDPSALVMGPGAAQQPNAGAATPAAPPVTAPPSGGEDYKDALKGAASRAASAAVKRSPLPVPKVSLGGTNLRGLGVAGGGTSASGSLGPIGPAAGSNGANGSSGLNLVRGAPGFRGVAGARSPTGSGLDGTKKAGANAGDAFSRTGSALSGLNAAANEQIPTGGQGYGGGGGGGAGANDKGGGGSGPGGSKSVGESLAFIEAKERMMENLKLEFEKRKLKDPELLLYGIRNDILKASGAKIGEALTKTFMCKVMVTGCPDPDAEYDCGGTTMSGSQMGNRCNGSGGTESKPAQATCWIVEGSIARLMQGSNVVMTCAATGKGKGDTKPGSAVSGSNGALNGGITGEAAASVGSLNDVCTQIDEILKGKPGNDGDFNKYGDAATQLVVLRDAMSGPQTTDCKTRRAAQQGALDGSGKDLVTSQNAAFDAVKTFNDKIFKDVQAEKVGDYAAGLNTASDSPVLLAKEANGVLKKISDYADEKKLTSPIGLAIPNMNLPTLKETQANKAKMTALKAKVDAAQTALAAYLVKAKAAQRTLDGGIDPNSVDVPVLMDLGKIADKPGTLKTVQQVNVDYKAKKEAIEKAATESKTTTISPDEKGITGGATEAQTKIKAVPETVPPETDKENYEKYKTAAAAARNAVESVRAAQSTWIVNVTNTATTAKESLTAPAKP